MISLKPGFTKRLVRTKFLSFIIFLSLIFFVSCNPSLRFAAVKYNAADIIRLLDSTKMDYLTLQNISPNAGNYKMPFTLISFARTADDGFVDTIAYNLQAIDGKKLKTFKGKTILGNLIFTRANLTTLLTDPVTGKRIDFPYLSFTPMRDKDYGDLYFEVQPGLSFGKVTYLLRPCPPAKWCNDKSKKVFKVE